MEHKVELLLYLDKRRFLIDMKLNCERFLNELTVKTIQKFPPFRHFLEIDVIDLLDISPQTGEFLLKEPLQWNQFCSEILYATLTSIDETVQVKASQVAVVTRVENLPRLLVRPNQRYYTGLLSFQGLLVEISKPTSYVIQTVWSCPEECEGNEVVLPYIPKFRPKCFVCKSYQFENSGIRRCGEHVTATFIQNNDIVPKKFLIVDDMISKLELGKMYNLIAANNKKSITVWNIEVVSTLTAPKTCPSPSDVEELFNICEGIPWKFIYCLSSTIGASVSPLNCFMHLKISLLLSLTSVKANARSDSNIIHILAAGYDTSYVGDLMTKATRLADRSVFLGCGTSVPPSLIASSGGVCVMSLPLYTYTQKQLSSLFSILEAGEFAVESNKVTLRSAIWCQGTDFKKINVINIASVFKHVCRGDYGEYNEELVEFHLQNSLDKIEANKDEERAMVDVASYLDIVAGLQVTLTKFTERILRNYFLAARRDRPRGVSIGSMEALVTICLTLARLCRRSVTNVEDAVFAIWLHVCGCPEPRFAPEEYLYAPADINKLEEVINQFKEWLQQFTGMCFSGDVL